MPSLYHFNSDQFKENLILGGQQHMVAGRLCQYLKGWQLDGIRFLYKHFEKGESCILNDESGLGKVVTTAIFLGAILSNDTTKKCLIIVRDDEYIDGWRFHLSVLTQLSVKVIERTSDINQETVFLIKWSTIKDIGQISKTTFDHIIVDNRGEMLTNKFCTGILLRYYESKVSLVISSSDVTSDVNLLHILLRLCGRLDRQYADVKLFEEKFQLPALKEGVSNKIDLEDYFLKREKVINFCREFRLRRYRHQFDEQFPLVLCSDFKRHLEQWRNNSNSQTSGSAKLCSSSSEKDVEELFQVYFRIKKERDDRKIKESKEEEQTAPIECDDDKSNSSDELVVMSPLLFVSESESENEETQLRIAPPALIADEIKQEEENKNEKAESTNDKETMPSSVNRRKLTKPVKKPTPSAAEALSAKSLRSRKVAGCSKPPLRTKADDTSADSARKRGRPRKSKSDLNDDTKKESISAKDTRDAEKNPKEKTGLKSVKGEGKKKDSVADPNTSKPMDVKDDDKKRRKSPLKAEHTSKKDCKIPSERSTECLANAKPGKEKEAMVGKSVTEAQNSKANEKKCLKPIRPDKEHKEKVATAVRRTRSKIDDEDYDPFEGVVVKVKKKKMTDDVSPTKRLKDTGNQKRLARNASEKDQKKPDQEAHPETASRNEKDQRRHANDASGKDRKKPDQETHPETTSKKSSRSMLDLVIEEANKFLKVQSPSAEKGKEGSRRTTRTSEKSPVHAGRGVSKSKSKSPNSSKKVNDSNVSPNRPKHDKEKSDTPKRHKPLTVYTLLGVHSRSTRGMQRYTRSSSVQNKYMKVSEAQVGLDKLSKPKRLLLHRQSMVGELKKQPKTKPSAIDIKPDTECVPESCGILESMQLGQALTPTNGCTVADLAVPIPKKVGYDFPLMLDKEIPDSECIMTSQSSNKNEVIILTGSSTSDSYSEMEPPKTTVNRRTSSMKPPMVTIPRQAHNKAKSPDLFSTCSDLSLPCSQQKSTKSTFEGFKIFGSEVRQHLSSTPLDGVSRNTQHRADCLPRKIDAAPRKDPQSSPTNHPVEDEDAMFEITSNGTFNNIIRVNSNGELSPLRNKNLSTPPSVSHQRNRITNYLIGSNQQLNGTSPSPSLDDQIDNLQKTPKRRKSLSGTMKRSPRGIIGSKMQSTKLTQWLIKNSPVVRISDKPLKASSTKRKRLDLLFPDDK